MVTLLSQSVNAVIHLLIILLRYLLSSVICKEHGDYLDQGIQLWVESPEPILFETHAFCIR